jgi:hypothetical protein
MVREWEGQVSKHVGCCMRGIYSHEDEDDESDDEDDDADDDPLSLRFLRRTRR